jgi:hypothetical protein
MAEEGFAPKIRAIKRWQPEVRKELIKELRAAGEMIAGGARLLADAHSTKISATIKVRTRTATKKAEVEIKAGNQEVPEAGLLELGNKGSRNKEKFRHPVFGDKSHWVEQPMHPYLAPAVKRRKGDVAKRIKAAVVNASTNVRL